MAFTKQEKEVIALGFEFDRQYNHDGFNTKRFSKGDLEVEFTYKGLKLQYFDLTIQEINHLPIAVKELETLDKIINKK